MKKLAGEIKQPKRKPQGGVQERKATAFPLLLEGENKKRAIGAEPVLRDMNESPRGKIESRMASGLAGLLAEIGDCWFVFVVQEKFRRGKNWLAEFL